MADTVLTYLAPLNSSFAFVHAILDYFVISKIKLDQSFPNAKFNINGYKVRTRRDSDSHGGGLIEFFRKGFASKRLK